MYSSILWTFPLPRAWTLHIHLIILASFLSSLVLSQLPICTHMEYKIIHLLLLRTNLLWLTKALRIYSIYLSRWTDSIICIPYCANKITKRFHNFKFQEMDHLIYVWKILSYACLLICLCLTIKLNIHFQFTANTAVSFMHPTPAKVELLLIPFLQTAQGNLFFSVIFTHFLY